MRRLLLSLCPAALLLSGALLAADKFDEADYKKADYSAVRAAPEDYKNKLVCFQVRFGGLRSDFPRYMEEMGFKDDKYFLIYSQFAGFHGGGLPMIMRKTAESKEAFQGVEEGSQLMVYGKVRKFQRNLVNRNFSDYYLDVEKAVPQSAKPEPAQSQKSEAKPADSGSQAVDGLGSLPKAPKDYGKPR